MARTSNQSSFCARALAPLFSVASAVIVTIAAGAAGAGCSPSEEDDALPSEETAESRCVSCHMPDYRHAHPVHVKVKPKACPICHTEESWHPAVLRHEMWPLTGKHEKTKCFACHTGTPPVFHGTGRACSDCHGKERKEVDERQTWHAHFQSACGDCHQTAAWKPAKSEPGFVLQHAPTAPTHAPSASAAPIAAPTITPTITPTPPPTPPPSPAPSAKPTAKPKPKPAPKPTASPTIPDPLSGASRRR